MGERSTLRGLGESCVWLIAIGVVVYGVVQLASRLQVVVLPIFLALVLGALLSPLVGWLRAHRWPPAAAALAVLIAGLGVLGGLVAWIAPQVSDQVASSVSDWRAG